ncbi:MULTISPECIES: helix-turn-helix domain-containing protein [Actinomadura]|uniref:Transcriptional regulator n=1 Tax=Actinomadura litoris TaxID=2678616 RepID=A0A7K1LA78_9ACTN|nr:MULTISPECIES: helix-turn-helix domain-containing protein [Actinomadura]MBT2207178.1 helix-turn-helix transcriptional regulator [Actinomadura sp. NEAU-AAG7]MUN41136.1 transcriptional regulator [Actinomadura litoris]
MGDEFHKDCPAREVLGHLAGRWTILVLTALLAQPRRYHELRAVVEGISDKSLAATLRALQQDGLVHREVGAGQPPPVTYSVTPLGRGAAAALDPLLRWIRANAKEITAHRRI